MSVVAAMIEAVEEVKPRRVVSEAKVAANQRNAQRSTGPKTEAGKARARANAVKHGLTGAGIAVPGEDRVAIEARFVELQAELQPSDTVGMLYVEQAALMSVRVQRAARQEAAALATVARNAEREFDLARLDEVDRLWDDLAANPGPNRRRLMTTPEGIDRLASALGSVRVEIAGGKMSFWGEAERAMVEVLFGRRPGAFPPSPTARLLGATSGDVGPGGGNQLVRPGASYSRQDQARTELVRLIDAELASLAAARAGLDPAVREKDRAGAATRALFDAGLTATAARKYEAAARREFHRSLRDFHAREADLATPEPQTEASPQDEPGAPESDFQNEPTEPAIEDESAPTWDLPARPERGISGLRMGTEGARADDERSLA